MIFIATRKLRVLLVILLICIMAVVSVLSINWILRIAYPFHYQELIEKHADHYGVDPHLVVSIMRNESRFNPEAISRADAKGLMQIAPITGQWASERLEIENYTEEMLFEPDLNIQMGTWYLNILHKEFDDKLELIVAAYNAGNGNVTKWLGNPEYSPDGETLEYIPFGETRFYSKKVLRDYKIYKRIYR
ncbi:Lytic transglycosylase, catalytic [Alkaliphilus metalliredigens QYMF]|uniref:Lytic transglycosylase, catalytic n=1 Tax=Alkaliphilus metalliredigens (strain QYMF) TaxID=293826 RepID=A6TSU4_ALKMQ|nr:lytic transglycosylase domain-containing protein [Alkaliphilus metalliredigens]ABR49262.1 Lytic transglycosylase, catalytic [Alkaliphilus metalliredigens QYMF]